MSGNILDLCKGSTTSQDMDDTFRSLITQPSHHLTRRIRMRFWQAYSLVGNNCSQSSNIPATVCVGHCFQPLSHQKQPSKLRLSSSLLAEISSPYQFCSCTASNVFCCNHILTSAFSFSAVITSPLSCFMQVGFGYSSCNWRSFSSAYLAASLTNELYMN